MSERVVKALLILTGVLLVARNTPGQSSYDLLSPDKRIEVRIRTADGLRYDVLLQGRILVQNCTFSMDVEHRPLGLNSKIKNSKERSHTEMIEPAIRQKSAAIRDKYNELRLDF